MVVVVSSSDGSSDGSGGGSGGSGGDGGGGSGSGNSGGSSGGKYGEMWSNVLRIFIQCLIHEIKCHLEIMANLLLNFDLNAGPRMVAVYLFLSISLLLLPPLFHLGLRQCASFQTNKRSNFKFKNTRMLYSTPTQMR